MTRSSVQWTRIGAALLLTLLGLSTDRGLLPGTDSAVAAEISYIYDDLGRLRAAVDPASDTAVYNYDAVGNLLSITRQSSSATSIIEFTPKEGPIGTTVTIFGTGFSTTPGQNSITFNGVSATVTSSTETKIVTTVSSGATTGTIGITAPSGSASSAEVFTVTTSSGAPTITSFTPTIGTPGTAVTITGTNFETVPGKNHTRFNISSAVVSSSTSTSINTSVPTATGSGRISVTTVKGKALSNDDFFIPPAPYTASDVAYTGRMSIDGPSHTATIGTSNKIGLIVFDGLAGQRVGLGINSIVSMTNPNLYVYTPSGSLLVSDSNTGLSTNFHMTLPTTGTYTIMVDPDGTQTGSVTLTLSSEADAGTIEVDGASVAMTTTRVGQQARLRFDGTVGQIVSLGINSLTSLTGPNLYVYRPDGTLQANNSNPNTNTNFHMVLPATGTYTIIMDPDDTQIGSMTLTLSSEVDGGTLTINGASSSITISRVGQRARLTFSGTASQQVTVQLTNNSIGSTSVALLRPDGTQLIAQSSSSTNFNLKTQTLPTTGTYTILVDPAGTNTGSITVSVTSP